MAAPRRAFTAAGVRWLALLLLCAAYLQGGFVKALGLIGGFLLVAWHDLAHHEPG